LAFWGGSEGKPQPNRTYITESANLHHAWLEGRFETILPSPDVHEQRKLVRRLAKQGRPGGAVCDALIGLTSQRAGATLVTADRRAVSIYELLEVPFEML